MTTELAGRTSLPEQPRFTRGQMLSREHTPADHFVYTEGHAIPEKLGRLGEQEPMPSVHVEFEVAPKAVNSHEAHPDPEANIRHLTENARSLADGVDTPPSLSPLMAELPKVATTTSLYDQAREATWAERGFDPENYTRLEIDPNRKPAHPLTTEQAAEAGRLTQEAWEDVVRSEKVRLALSETQPPAPEASPAPAPSPLETRPDIVIPPEVKNRTSESQPTKQPAVEMIPPAQPAYRETLAHPPQPAQAKTSPNDYEKFWGKEEKKHSKARRAMQHVKAYGSKFLHKYVIG